MSSNQDSLTYWMNQAGSKPLLDQADVDEMARHIQAANSDCPIRKKYINKIVSHNLRLVVKSVHLFMKGKTAEGWGSANTIDYLQVGAIGLHRAAEKYDPTRGYKFSTYATHWIRSFVGRYNLKTISSFTIPEHTLRNAYYFETHGKPKARKSGIIPSLDETVEMIEILHSAKHPWSLDAVAPCNDELTLLETIESHYLEPQEFAEGCFEKETEDAFVDAGLSPEQVQILRGLYVDNVKARDIQQNLRLSQGRYLKLKKEALEALRDRLQPV